VSSWIVRAGREWPLWIALAGILSLFLLPRAAGLGSASVDADRRELDVLRREADPAVAESRLATFLARHPQSAEAQVLLARATLARARSGQFPGAAAFQRAWSLAPDLRRETAALMSEYGLLQDAVDRLNELHDQTRDPELALDLVPALTRLAADDPALRHKLLDLASTRISDYLRVAPADRRVQGLIAQARICREERRDEELVTLLTTELAGARTPGDRGLLHLERGRAFSRLGKHREMEAMSSFDEAEKLLVDPFQKGLAVVHQAELFAGAGNPDCLDFCTRLIAVESPAAPLAHLVAGAFQLKSRPAVALEALKTGVARIRRPAMIEDLDFPRIYTALLAAADRNTDPDLLGRIASILGEVSRLKPVSTRVALDHAAVLLRARRYEEAADRFLAAGAVRQAADACAEGGLHLRAAALYRRTGDADGLFRRAVSLRKAGDAAGAKAGFEEYVAQAGPSGTFAGFALVEKAGLEGPEESLATFDRVLQAREVATSPVRDDWARALLGRGRALVRLSRPAEAGRILREFLERYPESPAAIEAAWLLVGVAVEERKWKEGLDRLGELDRIASRVPESDRAPYAEMLREARFVKGDVHFNLDDYASADRAFGEAVRQETGSEARLWGLIGRARALARLEHKEEARRHCATARAILDEPSAPAGRGREYWEIALEALEREVR
jgi:tetratricopeptide (TPR) repeat protein